MRKLLIRYGLSLAALAALSVGSALTAKADIIVMSGVNNQGTDNVLLNTATNVPVVTGSLNQNSLTFGFQATSTGGNLNADASGQAVITAAHSPFTNITFGLTDGATFTRAVFNLNSANDGTMTIRVTGINIDGGVFEEIVEVDASGENFFTVDAINGQLITSITLIAGSGVTFEDLRQVRIGGAAAPGAIPEPATMLLLGTGLAGVAAKVRKRRKAA